jgi:hypothetical protein
LTLNMEKVIRIKLLNLLCREHAVLTLQLGQFTIVRGSQRIGQFGPIDRRMCNSFGGHPGSLKFKNTIMWNAKVWNSE